VRKSLEDARCAWFLFSFLFCDKHDEIWIARGLESIVAKLILNGYQEQADNNTPCALRLL
jgi:hypothetical protein